MAYNNLSSASVDVWDHVNDARQSLADTVFAATSVSGIEMADDYEPVVYQSTRALMGANAVQELQELQAQNHATTAYSTLNCAAKPLFPMFDAQRQQICNDTERRERPYDPAGFPLSAPICSARLDDGCSAPGGEGNYSNGFGTTAACTTAAARGIRTSTGTESPVESVREPAPVPVNKFLNSIRGAVYDLKHWKDLPQDTATDTWKFIATREGRAGYLLLLFTLILFLIAVLMMVISNGRYKKKHAQRMMLMMRSLQNNKRQIQLQNRQTQDQSPPMMGGYGYGGRGYGGRGYGGRGYGGPTPYVTNRGGSSSYGDEFSAYQHQRKHQKGSQLLRAPNGSHWGF